jgi:hypothetical protein
MANELVPQKAPWSAIFIPYKPPSGQGHFAVFPHRKLLAGERQMNEAIDVSRGEVVGIGKVKIELFRNPSF